MTIQLLPSNPDRLILIAALPQGYVALVQYCHRTAINLYGSAKITNDFEPCIIKYFGEMLW